MIGSLVMSVTIRFKPLTLNNRHDSIVIILMNLSIELFIHYTLLILTHTVYQIPLIALVLA